MLHIPSFLSNAKIGEISPEDLNFRSILFGAGAEIQNTQHGKVRSYQSLLVL